MEAHRIVCVDRERVDTPPHDPHIVFVGTGRFAGQFARRWTVPDVYAAMERGETFYTLSRRTGRMTPVAPRACRACGRRTLASAEGAAPDADMGALDACAVR